MAEAALTPHWPLSERRPATPGGASRLERTIQSVFLDLGGRPPLRFFRLACSWLKYSEPRLAISFPPFRPSFTAAGSFFFGKIQRVINLLTVLCPSSIRDKHRVLFIASFHRHRENSESVLRFRSGAPPSANAPNRQPRPPERSSPRGA